MKYALTFALLGALVCYWAVSLSGWWYLLVWIAISFFILSAGYAGLGAKIFCKRSDGTIPLWVKIIHFPFLLYLSVVWTFIRMLSRENPFDKVGDDLILGRRLFTSELPHGIVNYVDLTTEFEDPKEIRETTNYVCLPILDASVPSSQGLISALSRLRAGTTYVHCAQGHGRTALFALALLWTQGGFRSFEDGFFFLKKVRPGIGLNKAQEAFIKKFIAEQGSAAKG
jgi:protein-tyrosine phosphatase